MGLFAEVFFLYGQAKEQEFAAQHRLLDAKYRPRLAL